MGIFDKIKNALFEEEYVEVEEKPIKPKKIEKPKKESVTDRPIAKKVILPEKHEVRVEKVEEEDIEEEVEDIKPKKELLHDTNNLKFPLMDDNDFKMDNSYQNTQPKIVKIIEDDVPKREERPYSKSIKKEEEHPLYGAVGKNEVKTPEYGAYEKKEDKSYFKPSPIISPIYGILDKNYKKEEIVNKREVRLTSSYARENLNVDDVRRKAFGSLEDDIANNDSLSNDYDEPIENNYSSVDDNLLVDLSDDTEKPKVKEVTMGDAEEYFQDLGLEYDIDYKDASRSNNEVTEGRHVKIDVADDYDEEDSNESFDVSGDEKKDLYDDNSIVSDFNMTDDTPKEEVKIEEPKREVVNNDNDDDSDDNLFDLIDSMYDRES